MRKFLVAFTAAVAVIASARAQQFPQRPVTLIQGYTAGGPFDILARGLAERMQEKWKQPVNVEARPGNGAMLAADHVAKQAPDGYTLHLAADYIISINMAVNRKLDYDMLKEFTVIAPISSIVLAAVANSSFPPNNIAELIAYIKANPGKVNLGVWSFGGFQQLAGAIVAERAGAPMTEVPYKGSSNATPDLVEGRINLVFDTPSAQQSFVESGKAKLLGVTSKQRLARFPNVPAIAETIPGYDVVSWAVLLAPAGMPEALADRLNREMTEVVKSSSVQAILDKFGWVTTTAARQNFHQEVRRKAEEWRRMAPSLKPAN